MVTVYTSEIQVSVCFISMWKWAHAVYYWNPIYREKHMVLSSKVREGADIPMLSVCGGQIPVDMCTTMAWINGQWDFMCSFPPPCYAPQSMIVDVSEVKHVWSFFFKRLTWGSRFLSCNLPKYIEFWDSILILRSISVAEVDPHCKGTWITVLAAVMGDSDCVCWITSTATDSVLGGHCVGKVPTFLNLWDLVCLISD